MAFIASHFIADFAERPVIDQTGLSGTFDIVVEFVPDSGGRETETRRLIRRGQRFYKRLRNSLGSGWNRRRGPRRSS